MSDPLSLKAAGCVVTAGKVTSFNQEPTLLLGSKVKPRRKDNLDKYKSGQG